MGDQSDMQLDEALRQISDIRQQMARSKVFRGYRSIPIVLSGVMAILAAAFQTRWVASPETELGHYLGLWIGVAAISMIVAGAEMYWRSQRVTSERARRQTFQAVEQFVPFLVVGGLLTLIIYRSAPQAAWMLPGLWSVLYGLGIFASRRLLPRPVIWVGSYFILCGFGCLLWGQGDHVLSPWQMGVSFGGGQLLGAAILYWTLERIDVSTQDE